MRQRPSNISNTKDRHTNVQTVFYFMSHIAHALTFGLAATFVYYTFIGNIDHAIFAGLALLFATVPFLVARWYDVYVPPLLRAGYIVFIATAIVLGSVERFYDRFPWWDSAIHSFAGFGGAVIAYIAFAIVDRDHLRNNAPWLFSLAAVSLSISMSVLWEIFEFAIDDLTKTTMQTDNADTMWDLTGATVSALFAGYIGWRTSVYHAYDSVLSRMLETGVQKNQDLT